MYRPTDDIDHAFGEHILPMLDIDGDECREDLLRVITDTRKQCEFFYNEILTPLLTELEERRVKDFA